jgi:nucleotide-binding universal stress UspA family protein
VRVLVAIDGSREANAAVAWLGLLPLSGEHTVRVITVVAPSISLIDVATAQAARAELIAEARRLVDDTASELRISEDSVRGEVIVESDAREAIVGMAREWEADLIAMGTRGLGAVARFFLGSVSLAVARQAPCSVLICNGPPRDVNAITVALDGSDHARQALEWLTTALALPPSTRVRLLGVAAPQHYPSRTPTILGSALAAAVADLKAERRARLEAQLSEAAATLRARLPAIETAVLTGEPRDMIVWDVEHSGTDLVVLGARGLGGVARLPLGSVPESLLTHARCSMLIVRAKGHDRSIP